MNKKFKVFDFMLILNITKNFNHPFLQLLRSVIPTICFRDTPLDVNI